MPVTRSKSGKTESARVTAVQSATTSTERTTSTEQEQSASTEQTERTETTETTAKNVPEEKIKKSTRRVPSQRSTIAREQLLAELAAKEQLAEQTLKEAKAARELAEIRMKITKVRQQEPNSSDEEDDNDASVIRVQEWLKTSGENIPIEKANEDVTVTSIKEKIRGPDLRGVDDPQPARQATIDVASLSTAFAKAVTMSRNVKHIQDLPTFVGRSDGWLAFKAAYQETQEYFTRVENTARLRKALQGSAVDAVSSLLISQANPNDIIQALERRFGRPEALIMAEMEKVRNLHKISDNPRDICIFASKIANAVATVEALKKIQYLYNPEMARVIVEKLSPILKNKWYDYSASKKEDVPELKKLAAFLNDEADKCGAYAPIESTSSPEENQHARGARRKRERTFSVREKAKCPSCQQEHSLHQCKLFINADIDHRWEEAKKHRVCFKCLELTHRRGQCKAKLCDIENCNRPHNRLLHYNKKEAPAEGLMCATNVEQTRRAYLKILPVVLSGPDNVTIEAYALLDEGSTITIIDEAISNALGADGPTTTMWIQGINNGGTKHEDSKIVDLKIRGKHCQDFHDLRRARTVKKLDFTKQSIQISDIKDCKHLQDIAISLVYNQACPKILIGQDNWELIVSREVRAGQKDQPVASHTHLGWVLHGCSTSNTAIVNFCGHVQDNEDSMENMMRRFFDIESLGIEARKPRSDPDERALQILHEQSRRLPCGRFETGLLWRHDDIDIRNNRDYAKKRLFTLEKKLDRDVDLKDKYKERIHNLFNQGYAEPATSTPTEGKTWYLPHFAVINPEKPKIRLVHDAAAKYAGVSLNDMLLSGPDLLQSLPGIIMRFRQHPYAVTADIKEMFMQIKIRNEDRDALRFLWREDNRGDADIQEYRMTSVIFGATSSPCTALYIKNRNAEDYVREEPQAVEAIMKRHYMDDYIASFENEEKAINVSLAVDRIHRRAGFELRGWASNSQSVVNHFSTDQGITTIPIGRDNIEKTLGLQWELERDSISFSVNMKRAPPEILSKMRPPTKREALSVIMSLFDPLGLISPVTTPAKRLMQDTWRHGTGWDEPLPEELQPKWYEWLDQLRAIEHLHIPRCYDTEPVAEYDIHTFVDASEEAYCAAIYIRMRRPDGSVRVTLAAAKSRVTPLKLVSIPRLELQAAVLGIRLTKTIINEHEFAFKKKTYWSDSRTALAWIRAEPRSFKTFVAHRLAEIEEATKKKEWRWVPTKDNISDDATRSTPDNFNSTHRWFHGPAFLAQPEDTWPTEIRTVPEKTGEEKEKCCATTERLEPCAYLPHISRFSKWTRLVRATARVLQFIEFTRKKKEITTMARYQRTRTHTPADPTWQVHAPERDSTRIRRSPNEGDRVYVPLEARLLIRAETLLIKASQLESYEKEIQRVKTDAAPTTDDKLLALSLRIDTDGILRLRGRIGTADGITAAMVDPVVLEGRHRYTKMYIQHVHDKMHHAGVELIVNEIRQRMWVVRLRPTVREVLKSCPPCRIRRCKPPSPATGDLPAARLAHDARPFTFTGLDYFGPIDVTVGRRREKRYIALFTCMTSRAVHLEVASSLSADSAIAALRRFIARRGLPKELWSDNATCFKAADRELATAALEALGEESTSRHISWRFLPPSAPFMAGVWERMVRTVKEALRATLHQKNPHDETLHTLIVEAENTVNSRPLTHVSVSPDDEEALTPNHILLGRNCHVPAPGTFTADDLNARQHWRRAQRLADEFWKRWVREYRPLLQHRREPRASGTTPKVGDIVIICDSNLPRNIWPRGRVTQLFPGSDGQVRVVDVRTANGHTLRRPTKKIVVLAENVSQSCDGGRNVHDENLLHN